MRVWWLVGLAPLLALPWVACGHGASASARASAPPAAPPPKAAARVAPGAAVTAYTPAGCDYTVTIPDATTDATMDGPRVGPDAAPRHVHASWAGAPSSTFAVNWSTGRDTQLSSIVYGTDKSAVAAGTAKLQHGHTFTYDSGTFLAKSTTRIHEAHVCGLAPQTTYYYKVGGPGHWSRIFDLATAPAERAAAPFRFVVSGDSRNEPQVFAEVEQRMQGEAPDFQIFTGDAVGYGKSQNDWDAFFEARAGSFHVEDALARIPLMAVNGNHEALALNYFAQFAFPEQESPGESAGSAGEEWYAFDYGNAHFAMLNDTAAGQDAIDKQAEWLRQDLAKVDRAKTPWIFAVHHKPLYTCSAHSPDTATRKAWEPIYDQYKVDVVLNGHNHCYERSVPIRAGRAADNGTIYVTAGGAGAPLYPTANNCPLEKTTESTRGYVVIDIDGKKLDYKAVRLDGSEIEKFELAK